MDDLIHALKTKLQRDALLPNCIDGVFSPWRVVVESTIIATEHNLGFTLRPLLKRIYTEAANGGFGPESEIIGVADGYTDDWGYNVEDLYEYFTVVCIMTLAGAGHPACLFATGAILRTLALTAANRAFPCECSVLY